MDIFVYEGGIIRVIINEKDVNKRRFRITEHDMGASFQGSKGVISVDNLSDVMFVFDDRIEIKMESQDKRDQYEYVIKFKPFRIEQRINGITTIVVNENDSLYFENY